MPIKIKLRLQNRAMKYFLGVNRFAPTQAVRGDMGWQTCQFRRKVNMIRLWNRLLSLDHNRLPKIVFNYEINSPYRNWSYNLKQLFHSLELEHIFESKSYCPIKLAENRLIKLENLEWAAEKANKPKLRTYSLIKTEFYPEQYVTQNLNKSQRSALAQIRMGILPLHIETGRYVNKPEEQRYCSFCLNYVESEFHFICECDTYSCQRRNLYSKINLTCDYFKDLNDRQKFVYILQHNSKWVSEYITECMKIRSDLLYN